MAERNLCPRCGRIERLRVLLELRAVTSAEVGRLEAETESARLDLALIDARIAEARKG